MSNVYKEIVSNLQDRVHPINVFATLAGVGLDVGLPALRELVAAGRIRETRFHGMPMYKLVSTTRVLKAVK